MAAVSIAVNLLGQWELRWHAIFAPGATQYRYSPGADCAPTSSTRAATILIKDITDAILFHTDKAETVA